MKEQLDKLVDQVVSVVLPLGKTTSLSFRGELQKGTEDFYNLSGNPALLFHLNDVDSVEKIGLSMVVRLDPLNWPYV